MSLDDLGPRLCIMGPSNSGKSTLADAIGRARTLPAIHLDRLHHIPGTDWQPRPAAEFAALHAAAIAGERWVIDGNYTRHLPARLARATGVILLDVGRITSLWRYGRRTWFERDRIGGLDATRDTLAWAMIRYIAVGATARRRQRDALVGRAGLPTCRLSTAADLSRFYRGEALDRRMGGDRALTRGPGGAMAHGDG